MTEATAQAPDLEAISGRYLAAWEARNLDAIVALHTDDTQFWTHLGGEPVQGRDSVRAAFAELFERFPELSFETRRVFYGNDHWVLDWALISGEVRFDCLDVVTVSPDGLIARKDTFVDMVQLQASIPELHLAAERERSHGLPLLTALPVEHLCDMHVDLQPAQPIPTALGTRMTFIVTGGQVEGPKLHGELLPGGR